MGEVSIQDLYGVLILLVALCAIAGFLIGRKTEASAQGRTQGVVDTNITNLSNGMQQVNQKLDSMNTKMDNNTREWNDRLDKISVKYECEYRDLLVRFTELEQRQKSDIIRLDRLDALASK